MSEVQRPGSFRDRLKWATEAADPRDRLSRLTSLAASYPGYLETIQLAKALSKLGAAGQQSYATVRLAALGTSTIDHLVPPIRVAALRRNLLVDVHVGRFGQYRQELLNADSPLGQFRPAFVLLSLTSDDALAGISVSASRDAADNAIDRALDDLRSLWRTARERFGAGVIQQSFLDVTEPLFGNHDRLIPGAPRRLVARLNERLADVAAEDGISLLDVTSASAREGLDAWFDPRHWLQGKMEIAPGAAGSYGELLARLLGAQLGRSKKCLVLDLDNTLWGGVLGDDGLEGVKLGQGSAVGEAHLALQKYAKRLKERGVVLAVCSKNEWSVVEAMFDRHPEMWLRRSDIAAFAVNWNDKAENLQALARQLNLGLDSFVFVDDNAVERARIRESLPMVTVPELPDDPAHYVRAIARGGYFEGTALTKEDSERAAQYAANSERDALRDSAKSIDDFLRGLQMSVVYGPVTRVDQVRAGQLINKTNQFNTTTQRIGSEELEAWVQSPKDLVLQFRLIDRFGDNGLVSVMLFRRDVEHSDVFELVNWVMSCRVFGRQLEHEAMNIAVEAVRARGVKTIKSSYVPTEKNAVVSGLFASLGFQRAGDVAEAGASRWTLDLTGYRPHATHIVRKGEEE